MEDAVRILRDTNVITHEEANRVLMKASDTNLSEEERQKVEAIKARSGVSEPVRKGVSVGLGSTDPTLAGGKARPIAGNDPGDYSF